jgi:hypothetical protein
MRPRRDLAQRADGIEVIIPFPNFNPVLVTIGPFVIRWYGLAYIFGILLGWVYARAIICNEYNWVFEKNKFTSHLLKVNDSPIPSFGSRSALF